MTFKFYKNSWKKNGKISAATELSDDSWTWHNTAQAKTKQKEKSPRKDTRNSYRLRKPPICVFRSPSPP